MHMVAYIPEPHLKKLEPMQRADASDFSMLGGGGGGGGGHGGARGGGEGFKSL